MKTCFKCHQAQPDECFYTHKHMGDGRLNKCKSCTKSDTKARYHQRMQEDPAFREREIIRAREKNLKRAQLGINYKQSQSAKLKWSNANPTKRKAQFILRKAVLSGEVIKGPCEICGILKTQAHHDDYSRPLDVRWLCSRHHHDHHIAVRAEARNTNPF